MNEELTPKEYEEIRKYYGKLPNIDVYPKQLKHKIVLYRYYKARGLLDAPVKS